LAFPFLESTKPSLFKPDFLVAIQTEKMFLLAGDAVAWEKE